MPFFDVLVGLEGNLYFFLDYKGFKHAYVFMSRNLNKKCDSIKKKVYNFIEIYVIMFMWSIFELVPLLIFIRIVLFC